MSIVKDFFGTILMSDFGYALTCRCYRVLYWEKISEHFYRAECCGHVRFERVSQ